jgi:hypothetical protein
MPGRGRDRTVTGMPRTLGELPLPATVVRDLPEPLRAELITVTAPDLAAAVGEVTDRPDVLRQWRSDAAQLIAAMLTPAAAAACLPLETRGTVRRSLARTAGDLGLRAQTLAALASVLAADAAGTLTGAAAADLHPHATGEWVAGLPGPDRGDVVAQVAAGGPSDLAAGILAENPDLITAALSPLLSAGHTRSRLAAALFTRVLEVFEGTVTGDIAGLLVDHEINLPVTIGFTLDRDAAEVLLVSSAEHHVRAAVNSTALPDERLVEHYLSLPGATRAAFVCLAERDDLVDKMVQAGPFDGNAAGVGNAAQSLLRFRPGLHPRTRLRLFDAICPTAVTNLLCGRTDDGRLIDMPWRAGERAETVAYLCAAGPQRRSTPRALAIALAGRDRAGYGGGLRDVFEVLAGHGHGPGFVEALISTADAGAGLVAMRRLVAAAGEDREVFATMLKLAPGWDAGLDDLIDAALLTAGVRHV